MLKKYYSFFGPMLRILDALILIFSWLLAYYLRRHFPLSIMTNAIPSFSDYWPYLIVIVLLWSTTFSLLNLYSSHRITRRTIEAFKVLRAHTLALLIFISLTYLISTYKLSRGVFVYFGALSAFLLVYTRISLRNFVRMLRAKGYNLQRVVIVGNGNLAKNAAQKLAKHPELGLQMLGFFKTEETFQGNALDGLPLLGTVDDIIDYIHKNDVQKLVIALSRSESAKLETILSALKDDIIDVILIPDIYDYVSLGYELEDFDGLPLVSLNETPIMGFNVLIKRIFDVVISFSALVLLLPFMLVIALIIKISSKGPVFYSQERMSLNGKPFQMVKFRSMSIDQVGDVELLTKANDPRVTAIGKFIRKTSVDELPQFLNVLVGDMSIVGPRPERTWVVDEVRSKIPKYMLKHKVKAGITGWAQINGWRGNTSLEKRIEYDLYYIKNWSLLLDLKIIVLTIVRGFINKNAY